MASQYGILVDYDWCSGCHSCELACQKEHGYAAGQSGIKVMRVGPWQIEGGGENDWVFDHLPAFTNMCDVCAERRALGKVPTCVHHCQAQCLTFGKLDELAPKLSDHRKQSLVAL